MDIERLLKALGVISALSATAILFTAVFRLTFLAWGPIWDGVAVLAVTFILLTILVYCALK